MYRTILFVVTMSLLVAACGDQPFGDAGAATRDWLSGGTSTTSVVVRSATTTTTTVSAALRPSSELVWYTTGSALGGDDPETVIARVWERTDRVDEFVQASAAELVGALPGLSFPSVVPADVEHVTSQLVYTTDTGRLARDFQAAFGFWATRPYTRDRSVAQYAILWIARDSRASASIDDPGGGCAQFSDRVPETCRTHVLDSATVWLLTDRAGATLVWFDSGYRYELFHRESMSSQDALAMADSMEPLDRFAG